MAPVEMASLDMELASICHCRRCLDEETSGCSTVGFQDEPDSHGTPMALLRCCGSLGSRLRTAAPAVLARIA